MQQEHYIRRSQLSRNGTANAAAGTGDEVMFHLYRETILHFLAKLALPLADRNCRAKNFRP